MVKVKLAACVKCATVYSIVPLILHQYKYVRVFACLMSVSALYESLWNINRSTFQIKKRYKSVVHNLAVKSYEINARITFM